MPTVLYVEDDPDHRAMVQLVFEHQNVTLLEAEDGQEAVKKIKENQPDVILLDLFMPKLDGFGVLRVIKADPQTRHIPVIILSAWPTGDNRQRAKQAGAADFIAKPYEPRLLVEVVSKHLHTIAG